jgi:hypothetical protein
LCRANEDRLHAMCTTAVRKVQLFRPVSTYRSRTDKAGLSAF